MHLGFSQDDTRTSLTLPPPASHPVEFGKEIKPIFEASCVKCHGRGKAKGSFSLENRAAFLKGGDSGSAVVPGQSTNSYLIELVAGLIPITSCPKRVETDFDPSGFVASLD